MDIPLTVLAIYLFGSPDRMLRIDMSNIRSGNLERLTASPPPVVPTRTPAVPANCRFLLFC